jgi:hypothetical protein
METLPQIAKISLGWIDKNLIFQVYAQQNATSSAVDVTGQINVKATEFCPATLDQANSQMNCRECPVGIEGRCEILKKILGTRIARDAAVTVDAKFYWQHPV